MLKAILVSSVVTAAVAAVVGAQGTSAGPLAIESFDLGTMRVFWSWPLFLAGSGLAWGLILLQR